MPATAPIYRRLPGTGFRHVLPAHLYWLAILFPILLLVRTRLKLWLGPDHLLLVHEVGYREDYRRFYFSEIQAFTVARTHWGKVYNGVLGLLGGLAVAVAGLARGTGGDIVFFAMAGLFVIGLGINVALGPTCVCEVHTAVQAEALPPWCRLRRARRGLERIAVLIHAAQGSGAASVAAPAMGNAGVSTPTGES